MKTMIGVAVVFTISTSAHAFKPCEELKAEIAAKIEANGVPHYTLEIVPNDAVGETKKIVGSCDGGTQKILYTRGTATDRVAHPPAPAAQ